MLGIHLFDACHVQCFFIHHGMQIFLLVFMLSSHVNLSCGIRACIMLYTHVTCAVDNMLVLSLFFFTLLSYTMDMWCYALKT